MLQDIMTENKSHIMKLKDEKIKDKLFLNFNEQLIQAIL